MKTLACWLLMKTLVCCLLLSIASLMYASEELLWTPANIPGLKVAEGGTLNLGLWFHDDFGWLNAGWQLWITHDAGRSWILSLTPPEGRFFYDTYFINPSEGWAVADVFPSFLFYTKDGGTSWEKMEIELTQTSDEPIDNRSISFIRIYFKDSLHGLGFFQICEGFYPCWKGTIIARTEDGQHWTEIARGPSFPLVIGFADDVWINGASDDDYYSPNFGDTFLSISMPGVEPVFASPSYGWTAYRFYVGDGICRSDVLKTTDGGNTWSAPIFSRISDHRDSTWSPCLISEKVGGFLWYPSEVDSPSLFYMTYNEGGAWFSYDVPFRHSRRFPGYPYKLSCNRERKEVWLFPSFAEEATLFYASIEAITTVQPSSKPLSSTWGAIKKIRKEY